MCRVTEIKPVMGSVKDQLPPSSLLIHIHTRAVSEFPSFVLTTHSAIPRTQETSLTTKMYKEKSAIKVINSSAI